MAQVELPALRGRSAVGFMAALGLLDLLDRAGLDPRLSWTGPTADPFAVVTAARIGAVDDVAAVVVAAASATDGELPGTAAWPPDRGVARADGSKPSRDGMRADPAGTRQHLHATQQDALAGDRGPADTAAALVAELAGVDDKGDVRVSPLYPKAAMRNNSYARFAAATRRQLVDDPQLVTQALTGWRRVRGHTGFYLDPGALSSAAAEPDGKPAMAGVPAVSWLALVGWPRFLPLRGAGGQMPSWQYVRGEQGVWRGLVWPVWAPALDPAAVAWLLGSPELTVAAGDAGQLRLASTRAAGRLGTAGVAGVFAARRSKLDNGQDTSEYVDDAVPVARLQALP